MTEQVLEGRKIKPTVSPVHLSEPVTSVLLISRRGSYSVRPEGRKKRNVFAVHTQSVFHTPSEISGDFLKENLQVSFSTAFPASSTGLA